MIKAFNENPEISVLLVSLKAGGVALNLTAANYIFVMDPWWNPGIITEILIPHFYSFYYSISRRNASN